MPRKSSKHHTTRGGTRSVSLLVLGAAAFASGCMPERTDVAIVETPQSCRAMLGGASMSEGSSSLDPDDCTTAFRVAQEQHGTTAPRYESRALCEEVHGENSCDMAQEATEAGGGSVFTPFMAGYMMGNMTSASGSNALTARPVYASARGGFATTTGVNVTRLNTTGAARPDMLSKRPQTTLGKPPMTRAQVTARGGFGRASTGGASARGG